MLFFLCFISGFFLYYYFILSLCTDAHFQIETVFVSSDISEVTSPNFKLAVFKRSLSLKQRELPNVSTVAKTVVRLFFLCVWSFCPFQQHTPCSRYAIINIFKWYIVIRPSATCNFTYFTHKNLVLLCRGCYWNSLVIFWSVIIILILILSSNSLKTFSTKSNVILRRTAQMYLLREVHVFISSFQINHLTSVKWVFSLFHRQVKQKY